MFGDYERRIVGQTHWTLRPAIQGSGPAVGVGSHDSHRAER